MEMLKLCHHVCLLKRILEIFYQLPLTRSWRVFVTGNSEKLAVISQ